MSKFCRLVRPSRLACPKHSTSSRYDAAARAFYGIYCLFLVGCSPRTPIDVRTCEQNMPIVSGVEPDQAVIIKWVSVSCRNPADCLDTLRKHACELHGTEIVIQSDPSTSTSATSLWSVPSKRQSHPFDNLVVSAWITRQSSSGGSQD